MNVQILQKAISQGRQPQQLRLECWCSTYQVMGSRWALHEEVTRHWLWQQAPSGAGKPGCVSLWPAVPCTPAQLCSAAELCVPARAHLHSPARPARPWQNTQGGVGASPGLPWFRLAPSGTGATRHSSAVAATGWVLGSWQNSLGTECFNVRNFASNVV